MNYQVDKNGFYGEFGGAYVPEILYKCVHDLQEAYLPIIESEEFKQEYHALLKDYVGRSSPLYFAKSGILLNNATVYSLKLLKIKPPSKATSKRITRSFGKKVRVCS